MQRYTKVTFYLDALRAVSPREKIRQGTHEVPLRRSLKLFIELLCCPSLRIAILIGIILHARKVMSTYRGLTGVRQALS